MFFKRIYIEITNVCNLSCEFCPGTVRPRAFMTCRGFEEVLGRIAHHTKHIYLHVMGEPLLHPLIGSFLDTARRHGLFVNLTTNGSLLAERFSELSGRAALRQINISLHSGAVSVSHLDKILELRASCPGIILALRMWNRGSAHDERFGVIARAVAERFGRSVESLDVPPGTRGVKLGEGVYWNPAERFSWPETGNGEAPSSGFCLGLRDQVAVLCDGTVTPCCLDSNGDISLGNIFRSELSEIVSSQRALRLWNGFSEGVAVEPLCAGCGYRARFGRRVSAE